MKLDQFQRAAKHLADLLKLGSEPLGISFLDTLPEQPPRFQANAPSPTEDGRTGAVAASCVFWVKAEKAAFTTIAEDHGNCSVGGVTHGFKTLQEAASGADVAALVEVGWVHPDVFPHIPVVQQRPEAITYEPASLATRIPEILLLRLTALQAMMLSDAISDLKFEGKPQCHILAMARESGEVAVSVGCMLSRVRTGMEPSAMTCALPIHRLEDLLKKLEAGIQADRAVAQYAAEDSKRFATRS